MEIGGHVIELDTTDFARLDYQALRAQIKQLWASNAVRRNDL
jgi:hypothetical protein